MLAVNNKE